MCYIQNIKYMEPIDIDPGKQLIDVNIEPIKNEYFDSIKKEYYYTNNLNDLETEETISWMYERDNIIDITNFELKGTLNLESYTNKYIKLRKLLCAGNNFTTIICPETSFLTDFEFESQFIETIKFPINYNLNLDYLSETIVRLIFPSRSKFNRKIDDLPVSLRLLVLGNEFNNQLDNLPINLEVLFIGNGFNQNLNNLPIGLKILHFDFDSLFCSSITYFPSGIKHLSLPSNKYDEQISNTFNDHTKVIIKSNFFYIIN